MICSPPSDFTLSAHDRSRSQEEALLSTTQRRNSVDSFDSFTKDCFKDSSRWREIRQSKSGGTSTHSAKEYSQWWAQEDLRGRGLQLAEEIKCDANVEEEKRTLNGIHNKARQEEEEEQEGAVFASEGNLDISGVGSAGNVTVVALLKACADQKDLHKGSRIHADIVLRGLLKKNVFIGSSLVNLYAKCGALEKAQGVFEELSVRSIVSWNALIGGYAQHTHGEKALNCYEQMLLEGFSPNMITFLCILKACSGIGASDKGQVVHAHIVKAGLSEDARVGTALVDMYAACCMLAESQKVFNNLVVRDVVAWNALISGHVKQGCDEIALEFFERMKGEGVLPNTVTHVCSLNACCNSEALKRGQLIHIHICDEGLKRDMIGNALVSMYIKCGLLAKAQETFEKLSKRDVSLWNALIAGYSKYDLGEEALNFYEQMQREGVTPDAVTFVCSLK
eukprot:c25097_g4_i5 orf=53-1405(+)